MSSEIRKANARQNHGRGPCGQEYFPSLELCRQKVEFYRDQLEVTGSTMSQRMCEEVLAFWKQQLADKERVELKRLQREISVA